MPEIKIYKAVPRDAADLIEYFKKVGAETDNLLMDGTGLRTTVEAEQRYLQNINNINGIYLLADDGYGKIVAVSNCNVEDKNERHDHVYTLGISVLKDYWGRGIAHKMMNMMIEMVKEKGGVKIDLIVRADNYRAIALYVKCGFEIEGRLRKAMKVNGVFYDEYRMAMILK